MKQVKRYRVMYDGATPCKLITDFHELGCVVPAIPGEQTAEFRLRVSADNAISRTVAAKQKAEACYFPDFKGFDPLRFSVSKLEVEEYLINEPEAEE